MASQSLFLTKLMSGRRLRSFFVAAVMNRTPSTRWSFFLKSVVSSSASVVFLASFIVATSPSVIKS